MRLHRHRAAALIAAGLILAPASSAWAMPRLAPAAVLLRYNFVPGQSYAYRVSGEMHATTNGAGGNQSPIGGAAIQQLIAPYTITGVIRFHVLRVDEGGAADIEVRATDVVHTAQGGQSVTTPSSPPPSIVHVGPDGSVQGARNLNLGAYGLQALGSLPPGPVAPGARWTSTVAVNAPDELGGGAGVIRVVVHNVFSRYVVADGQRAAAIDGMGAPAYSFTTSLAGLAVHARMSGTLTSHSVFGLALHRLITNKTTLNLKLSLGKNAQQVFGASTSMPHVVVNVSMRPDGW